MKRSSSTAIVWFKQNSLRLLDNEPLIQAHYNHQYVIHIFCFEDYYFKPSIVHFSRSLPSVTWEKTGVYRSKFLLESVENLRNNLLNINQNLIIRKGSAKDILTELALQCNVSKVYCHQSDTTDEIIIENQVSRQLKSNGIELVSLWGNTLYNLNELPFDFQNNFPSSASSFRTICEKRLTISEPLSLPRNSNGYIMQPLPPVAINQPPSWFGELPHLSELCNIPEGYTFNSHPKACLDFHGGETAGLNRLREYFFETDSLKSYFQTRNGLLGPNYSSKFSPWLASGCLSPRTIVAEVKRYEEERIKNKDTYWMIFELHFREYFKFYSLHHGSKIYHQWGPRGLKKRNPSLEWNPNFELLQRWITGQTGNPFVDSNMIELNTTGFMSNRGRQIVASYLTRDLCVDWRYGAMYFESLLIDHDPALNWGNWTYAAGVGSDPREDRYFLIPKQVNQYDPEHRYMHHWIEETSFWSTGKMNAALKVGLKSNTISSTPNLSTSNNRNESSSHSKKSSNNHKDKDKKSKKYINKYFNDEEL